MLKEHRTTSDINMQHDDTHCTTNAHRWCLMYLIRYLILKLNSNVYNQSGNAAQLAMRSN